MIDKFTSHHHLKDLSLISDETSLSLTSCYEKTENEEIGISSKKTSDLLAQSISMTALMIIGNMHNYVMYSDRFRIEKFALVLTLTLTSIFLVTPVALVESVIKAPLFLISYSFSTFLKDLDDESWGHWVSSSIFLGFLKSLVSIYTASCSLPYQMMAKSAFITVEQDTTRTVSNLWNRLTS